MIRLQRPSDSTLENFLRVQSTLEFSYPAVGASAEVPPPGYQVDRTRVRLGQGAGTFDRARAALNRWDQFRLGWVETWPSELPVREGSVVVVLARIIGLWWLSACRVVYRVDDSEGPVLRSGFAYGTLPDHAETGEERFVVEWDRRTDEVWYDILAFSRPHWLLARLGYPFVRRVQKRFARDSASAMVRAIEGSGPFSNTRAKV